MVHNVGINLLSSQRHLNSVLYFLPGVFEYLHIPAIKYVLSWVVLIIVIAAEKRYQTCEFVWYCIARFSKEIQLIAFIQIAYALLRIVFLIFFYNNGESQNISLA